MYIIYSFRGPALKTPVCLCCVAAAGMQTCVALGVAQHIMKQVTKLVVHFLPVVEFLRKLSGPHCGTGSDVKGLRTKPASYFIQKKLKFENESPVIKLQTLRDSLKHYGSCILLKEFEMNIPSYKHTQMNIIMFLSVYLYLTSSLPRSHQSSSTHMCVMHFNIILWSFQQSKLPKQLQVISMIVKA